MRLESADCRDEHDGIGFLIMEYVPSKSLADLFHELNGPMDPTELLPILVQVARGLFVAHSHGVIHRDVKPANIMVSDNGEVKITDFGVSYSTNQEQITQDGMVVGTAQYISPEQAQGKHATPQSDIYSLGVVAYEGLCGHRPFTGATPVDIAAAHVNNPVPPLPTTNRPRRTTSRPRPTITRTLTIWLAGALRSRCPTVARRCSKAKSTERAHAAPRGERAAPRPGRYAAAHGR